jgi:ribosome biogenesis protein UTP30
MSQKPSQIVENISTAIPAIAKTIQGGWDNIQSLNIKTNHSVSLPIWSCTLDDKESGRWHGLQAKGDKEDVEDEQDASELKPATAQARKRPSDSEKEEEEEMKPKKRAKGEDHGSNVKGKLHSSKSSKIGDVETISRHQTQRRTKEPLLSVKSSLNDTTAPPTKESKSVGATTERKKTLDIGDTKSSQPPSSTSIEVLANQKSSDTQLSRSVSLRKTKSSSVTTTVTTSSRSDGKAGKKEKSPKTSDINSAKPSLSKEIKQKHSLDLLERKKQLVMKTKGRKSAKNAMLGKKVAQG